jgi:hypothetical protein
MRFWSEGLGDRELVMGLDRSTLERKGDCVVLGGVVDSPAPWEYEIKMQVEDWAAILRTATRPDTGDFIARKVGFGLMIAMALAIVKFVLLLGWHRLLRVTGLAVCDGGAPRGHEARSDAEPRAAQAAGVVGSKP